MLYANEVIYAGFLAYDDPSNNWDGSIFISKDKGKTWEKFCHWPKYEDRGVGFYKFSQLDDYGYIWGTFPIDSEENTSFHGTLRFDLVKNQAKEDPPVDSKAVQDMQDIIQNILRNSFRK